MQYQSKQQLELAWAKDKASGMVDSGTSANFSDALELAKVMVIGKAVYAPHLYRGGFVIRGFGYSVERIGKYVSAERAGSPAAV